ncbi:MAG: RagB/SusD family nutrient uptake outer membrane protein [Agriterribacter sp.]
MKKNISIATIYLFLFLSICSCAKLKETPYSFIPADQFYKTSDHAVAAINGCYKAFIEMGEHGYAMDLLYMIEVPTEVVTNSRWDGDGGDWDYARWTNSKAELVWVWRMFYTAINRCNAVLDKVPGIAMDSRLKNRILGEARFLRAHSYFNIVRLWGDAPLYVHEVTGIEQSREKRSPAQDIYQLIIEDLQFAAANCYKKAAYTAPSDIMRVSSGAAKAMLGKVYLTMSGHPLQDQSKLALAKQVLKEVIDEAEYSLCANYADIFDVKKKNGPEHIYSITFGNSLGMGYGNTLGHFFAPYAYSNLTPVGASWGEITMEPEFLNAFDLANDKRVAQAILLEYNDVWGGVNKYQEQYWMPYIRKYIDDASVTQGWAGYQFDIPVLRYADVLLMYAEVINEMGSPDAEAYAAFNKVRQRAGIADLDEGLSQQAFRDSMILERKREFFAEFHGWFDYVRKGILVSQMTEVKNDWGVYPSYYKMEEFRTLMPIPAEEKMANPNLEQNAGY